MATARQRADLMVVAQGLSESRCRAQAMIMAGQVGLSGSGRRIDKAGTLLPAGTTLMHIGGPPSPFVSRGGHKLEGALDHFAIAVADRLAVDVGASTGGFTDCLLQRGARRVFALDVGRGQLAHRLRGHRRVASREGLNVRYAAAGTLPFLCHLAVVDVSFIGLAVVLPRILPWLRADGRLLALVKPQFELTPRLVGAGGIVREPALAARAVAQVRAALADLGMETLEPVPAALRGQHGNQEYFLAAHRALHVVARPPPHHG